MNLGMSSSEACLKDYRIGPEYSIPISRILWLPPDPVMPRVEWQPLAHDFCNFWGVEVMNSLVGQGSQKIVSTHRPRTRAPKLFCFPFAGGNASSLRKLGDRLPSWLDVHYVELPGRGSRIGEELITDMEQMVELLANDLAPLCTGLFAFYGHSMGALLAYRTAHILRESYGLNTQLLIVSGARAPHLPRSTDELHSLPDAKLIARLEQMGGTDSNILRHEDLRNIMLKIVRADFKMLNGTFSLGIEPLSCPILAFGGDHDAFVDQEGVEGWRFQATGEFHCSFFHGGHFFIWDNILDITKLMELKISSVFRSG